MEPINRRPVMDIQPQRPQPQPLPRADFNVPATPAPALTPQPQFAPAQPAVQPVTPAATETPKIRKPVLAIIMALLIGAGLIGLTVFGYMRTKDKEVATPPTATTQKATTTDVDSSLSSTDAQLKSLDDTTDFNSNNLSDTNLGL